MSDQKKEDWFDRPNAIWWGKWVLSAALAMFSVFLYWEFAEVESGQLEPMSVPRAIALLYDLGGKWGVISFFVAVSAMSALRGVKQRIGNLGDSSSGKTYHRGFLRHGTPYIESWGFEIC